MPPSSPFADFAAVAAAVASTASKLRKRDLLAAYLRGLPGDDVPIAATYFAGRPLPGAQDRLGLGWVQQSQALAAASGADASALNAAYLRHSDLGDAAADLLAGGRPDGPPLTLAAVDAAFRAVSEAVGADARVAEMARLLGRATPD
jgi:DNA ligase 1